MRALIADKLASQVIADLESLGATVITDPTLKNEALTRALNKHDPDILVVRSTKVQAEHLAAAKDLSLVIRAGAGVNTIDLEDASRRGVYVANCPGKNAIAVAELAMGHLVNLDRRIADNVQLLRNGKWAKKEFSKAKGLYGRTLAVLGTGNIGQQVIRRAHAFGMRVQAWDKALTPAWAQELGVSFAESALDACRDADAVTIHLALNDETRGLVGKALFDVMAPEAYVINTSRGGVVDQAALEQAIKERGFRAGLDVFAEEPGSGDNQFPFEIRHNPSVYGTHHIGASTQQASDAVGAEVLHIIREFLTTGHVPNCVNLAERTPATHSLVVRHADRVGVLAGVLDELREGGINVQEMENIVFSGAVAACARIALDAPPNPETLARLANGEHVFSANLVSMELE